MTEPFIHLANAPDIPEGEARVFDLEDFSIAICHTKEGYFAIENICTHDDGPLGEGCLEGFAIECPRHGAKFDVRDGKVLQMPAAFPIRTFEIRVEGDRILVKVERS